MRSALFVPGDSERKQTKALDSDADALFLDLEDSVALDAKRATRAQVADFLATATHTRPALWVRINALDSGLADDDLAAIVRHAPAGIVLPKAEHGNDVTDLDARLRVHEAEAGLPDGGIAITAIVTETAIGVLNTGTYYRASRRLFAMTWGAEDLSADLGTLRQRDEHGRYTDVFRHARTQCLIGAIAAGAAPLDTVFPNFGDMEAFEAECAEAAADGFTGKMAIHPAQVPVINAAFTPSAAVLERAQAIVAAFAKSDEAGVIAVDGEMLDKPHLKKAEQLLARAARYT
ncbi:MAG: CoA ester lyase [Pseudomonadota bacterium]